MWPALTFATITTSVLAVLVWLSGGSKRLPPDTPREQALGFLVTVVILFVIALVWGWLGEAPPGVPGCVPITGVQGC